MNKRILDIGSVVGLIALIAFGVFAVAGGLGGSDTKAADSAREARCAAGAEDCDDTGGGNALGVCAPDTPDCVDTIVGGGDGSLNMCIEGATDCNDTVTNPDGTVSSGDLGDPGECSLVHNMEACEQKAVDAAFAALDRLNGTPRDELTVTSAKAVEWSDSCLGVSTANIVCAEIITPGYIVTFDTGVLYYEFHTDLNGNAILAQPAE